jgi:hypothetical protein
MRSSRNRPSLAFGRWEGVHWSPVSFFQLMGRAQHCNLITQAFRWVGPILWPLGAHENCYKSSKSAALKAGSGERTRGRLLTPGTSATILGT